MGGADAANRGIGVTQCESEPLGGGRCEREQGHEGKHGKRMPSGRWFEWSDESQTRLASEKSSRFD